MASDKKTWIKIFRDIQSNWLWKEKPFSKGQAWIDLILLAQSQDGKFLDSRGNLIDGERGTVYRSANWLAQRWGWSRSKAEKFLKQLESDEMIIWNKKKASATTTIKLVNYSDYQDSQASEKASRKQAESKPKASREHKQELQNDIMTEEKESIREKIPYSDIVDLYNSICVSYPRLRKLTDGRKAAIKARFNNGYTLDDFKELFEAAERSDFLKGVGKDDDDPWRASFDWLINEKNMIKVLEGNYENRKGGKDGGDVSGGESPDDFYRRYLNS